MAIEEFSQTRKIIENRSKEDRGHCKIVEVGIDSYFWRKYE